MYLCAYPLSFSLSRGDVLFILSTVSSLLPSNTDPSHSSPPNPLLPLIHTHCSTLLPLASPVPSPPGNGDSATSLWQESLPLNHYVRDQSLPWQQLNTRNASINCLPLLSLMEHCYQGTGLEIDL